MDVKDKGVMLELLSFIHPSPDLYACLEAPGESPGFQKRLTLVPKAASSIPGPYSDLEAAVASHYVLLRPFP